MRAKLILVLSIIIIIAAFYLSGAHAHLDLASIQKNLSRIELTFDKSPLKVLVAFVSLYVLMTGLSIPGAIVLTLLSGSIFGVWQGTLIVTVSCTLGAVISFLTSRYLFKESVERKFSKQFNVINRKLLKRGNFYFLTVRMIPVSPFVVINLVMGLTRIRLFTYAWMTFVGMLPGNLVYVYAGRKISEIKSPEEILTWPVFLSLTLIGLLPLLMKKVFQNEGESVGRMS